MNSLAARLVVAASIVLTGFVLITGLALEKAFESSAKQAVRDRLTGLIYALLGATDVSARGVLTVTEELTPDERLAQPKSGLRAYILSNEGRVLWRSVSASQSVRLSRLPAVGEWSFYATEGTGEPFVLAFGVRWSGEGKRTYRYTFLVAEDSEAYGRQLDRFRGSLFAWLLVSALILLLAQLGILKWGLAPLRKLTAELRSIEAGNDKASIDAECPGELRPLVDGMNALLRHERGRQQRIRNALDDLAHSAKTPLAVLQGVIEQGSLGPTEREQLTEQVARLDQIVRYQLQSAAARGRQGFMRVQSVRPIVDKLVAALRKVYRDKNITFSIGVGEEIRLRADPEDLMEILGNLLDNACKWSKGRVRVIAESGSKTTRISVEDDGPGFPPGKEQALLRRGARADTRIEGQGIGLAMVVDLLAVYGAQIHLDRSSLGGASVIIQFEPG